MSNKMIDGRRNVPYLWSAQLLSALVFARVSTLFHVHVHSLSVPLMHSVLFVLAFSFSARHNKNEVVEPWMLFPLDETAGRLLMWWWTQQAKKLVHSILFFILVSLNQTRTAAGGRFMESLQYRPTRKSPYETFSAFPCKICFTFVIVRSACNTFTTGYAANGGTRPRSLLAQLDMLHVVVQ